jgi:hypothetical protein
MFFLFINGLFFSDGEYIKNGWKEKQFKIDIETPGNGDYVSYDEIEIPKHAVKKPWRSAGDLKA